MLLHYCTTATMYTTMSTIITSCGQLVHCYTDCQDCGRQLLLVLMACPTWAHGPPSVGLVNSINLACVVFCHACTCTFLRYTEADELFLVIELIT